MTVTILKSQLFRIGGLEKYTWKIASAFCQKKIPVTILTTGKVVPPFQDPHLQIISFPIDHYLSWLNVYHFNLACQKHLEKHPTSIVFGLDRNTSQTHVRAGNGVHASYLQRRSKEEGRLKRLSFSLNPLHRLILKLEKQAFEHPDLKCLFTNSHMVKNEILSCYQTDPKKIHVVHNGVEWHELEKPFKNWALERPQLALKFGLNLNRYQFLFIGNNYARKGLQLLLQALGRIHNRDFELSVVGKEKNLSFFQQLVSQLKLDSQVHFFQERADVHSFYQIADALVIPSLYDPFANVTVEALAMGVFVVSSKTNGGHEILQNGNGIIIDSLDSTESIASALEKAMHHPKTQNSSLLIRNSIPHLDFSTQLFQLIHTTYKK